MDKKLFSYQYSNNLSTDFINFVFERNQDEDTYSKVYAFYYRNNFLKEAIVYDPSSSAIEGYDSPDQKEDFMDKFIRATSLSLEEITTPDTIAWWYERDYQMMTDLNTFFVRIWTWFNRYRPIIPVMEFAIYLNNQTCDCVDLINETYKPIQDYLIPTKIEQEDTHRVVITLPKIRDDRLAEMVGEMCGEESDGSFRYTYDEDTDQIVVEIEA